GIVGRAAEPLDPTEQAGPVQPAAGKPWHPTEGGVLVKVNIDPAEKDAAGADVDFVGANRGESRDEQGVVAERDESGGERVVVQTTAAEHARGAGGNGGDAHAVIVHP